MKREEVDACKTVALKHSSTLDRHAVVAADLDRGDLSTAPNVPSYANLR